MPTERKSAPQLVVTGQCVVTVARHDLPVNPDVSLVILVADLHGSALAIKRDFEEVLLFRRLVEGNFSNVKNRLPLWIQNYVCCIQSDLEKRIGSHGSDSDLSFRLLTSLLHFDIVRIRE